MKILLELIKMLLASNGEGIDYTRAQKIKDAIFWMLIGIAIFVGLLFMGDDDSSSEHDPDPIEVTE